MNKPGAKPAIERITSRGNLHKVIEWHYGRYRVDLR